MSFVDSGESSYDRSSGKRHLSKSNIDPETVLNG